MTDEEFTDIVRFGASSHKLAGFSKEDNIKHAAKAVKYAIANTIPTPSQETIQRNHELMLKVIDEVYNETVTVKA